MIAVIGAVIGAGIAGLQAAGQLQRLGVPFCVLEAGAEIGGLARTGVHQHWRYNDTRFLLVFLTQAPPQPWHWQFFADPRFPFYRLTYRHNFSNRFPPCLVAEVTDRGQPLPVREIVAALETIGIKPEWVAETREERLEFTYPIPTLRSEAEKPAVIAAF